jgi:hypothetical protein
MDFKYIKREIELSSLLGEELPSDVKEILEFFKGIVFRYEKFDNGVETWYDENDQYTIQIWEENWGYSRICYKYWNFLEEKYRLDYDQISDLIKDMLELTLNRKVYTLYFSIFTFNYG